MAKTTVLAFVDAMRRIEKKIPEKIKLIEDTKRGIKPIIIRLKTCKTTKYIRMHPTRTIPRNVKINFQLVHGKTFGRTCTGLNIADGFETG